MTSDERGQYSAAPSAMGYLYQCRFALLETLRRLSDGNRLCVGIETLDDVVFDTNGSAVDILQTKHHISSPANLTDASPDLWKTLRIWMEGQSDGSMPLNAHFFLITTAPCSNGTAADYLCPGRRDVERALERLNATALSSTNESNAPAYHAFAALGREDQERFVKSITVIDAAPSIAELDEELKQAVFFAVERAHLDSYLERLEGWWYVRVVKHLSAAAAAPILGEELEAEANRVRAQFKEDSLPVDDDIMQASVDAGIYGERPFVRQLRLIGVNEKRVFHAVRNYFRAYEQRSRWIREDLLYVGELDRYEARLIEEWDLLFQQMKDDLGEEAAEQAKTQAAQELYKWVEAGTHHLIRPAVTEPAIARGTYQIMADDLRVGWHLEFRERLQALLESTEVSQ